MQAVTTWKSVAGVMDWAKMPVFQVAFKDTESEFSNSTKETIAYCTHAATILCDGPTCLNVHEHSLICAKVQSAVSLCPYIYHPFPTEQKPPVSHPLGQNHSRPVPKSNSPEFPAFPVCMTSVNYTPAVIIVTLVVLYRPICRLRTTIFVIVIIIVK